jgi:lysozyme family protein
MSSESDSKDDVRNLQKPEATAIYMANYWNAICASDMHAGVDLAVFDAAVNTGIFRAATMLQAVVGTDTDGHIGPMTLTAAAAMSAADIITKFSQSRTEFYQSLSTFNHFGAGWLGRTNRCKKLALHLAGVS